MRSSRPYIPLTHLPSPSLRHDLPFLVMQMPQFFESTCVAWGTEIYSGFVGWFYSTLYSEELGWAKTWFPNDVS